MARTPTTPQQPADDGITDAQVATKNEVYAAASTALAVMDDNAKTVARRIGYEGALSVGALEDEIRFYQRQTVQAILETGKRLVVLKELTTHGEFESRVQLLGFSVRTARRFMAAASKVSKSANLADLSAQAKNGSAFLELITHDDDVIDALAEMDDFDKMSASQVRAAARELAADVKAKDEVLADKQATITRQQLQLKKKVVALTDWPDAFSVLFDQAAAGQRQIEKGFADLELVTRAALSVEALPGEEESRDKAFAALANRIGDALATGHKLHEDVRLFYGQTLENWQPAA